MIVHPLIAALLALDGAALLALAAGVWASIQVVTGWRPAASDAAQLRLERRMEAGTAAAAAALLLFGLSSLLTIAVIASTLPGLVPGAMCGTGVMQAMGPVGTRSLILRVAALALSYALAAGIRLDRAHATSPLAEMNAKLTLLLAPIILLAVSDTTKALLSINTSLPVDCCAVLLDSATEAVSSRVVFSDDALTTGTLASGALLLVSAGSTARRRLNGLGTAAALAVAALLFVPFATTGLIRVFSAYHYQVLSHHCPYCLFLPEHRIVGYPLFAALLLIAFEGVTALLAGHVGATRASLQVASSARIRAAGGRMAVAVLVYSALTAGPALYWYLRFGTWMGAPD